MRLHLLLSALLVGGCDGRDRVSAERDEARRDEPAVRAATPAVFGKDGLLSGPGAPERLACQRDADCVVMSIPGKRHMAPPSHLLGCCATSSFDPASRAFFDWVKAFQAQHCPVDRSACPPLPAPAQPAPCVHEARCLAGRCGNACPAPATQPTAR